MRVLELGGACDCVVMYCLGLQGKYTALPCCRAWDSGELTENGKLTIEPLDQKEPYDLIFVPHWLLRRLDCQAEMCSSWWVLDMIARAGYPHENSEIELMLLRKGIQPLNEGKFPQVIDYGIAGPGGSSDFAQRAPMAAEAGHILTGLEPSSIRKLVEAGFDTKNGTMQDPDTAMFTSVDDGPSMLEAVLLLVKKRFCHLILMPIDQLDDRRPLPSFGIGSMLAAEFRAWFWNTFEVDVPYIDIASPQKTLVNLVEHVEGKLVASWGN
ncbi:hypothetical protein SCARD494_12355 [Seiridium cardinale]